MRFVSTEPNTGCWLWTGVTNGRYGVFGVGYLRDKSRKKAYAHRLSYEWFVGAVPAGLFVMHKCDVPLCVNPDHMMVGTGQDNAADMARKGRGVQSRSLGLPYGVNLYGFITVPRPYRARVTFRGKGDSLGMYKTPEEAGAAAVAFKEQCYREGAPK